MTLTPKDKLWLKVGGGVAGAILLYKLLSPKVDTGGASNDPTGNGGVGTVTPGYTFNASVVAEKLYNAMKEMGTDEEAILKALTPITVQQFDQVIQKFGRRSYNTSLGNQIALPFFSLPLHPLQVWLKTELSTSRYAFLALKFPQL